MGKLLQIRRVIAFIRWPATVRAVECWNKMGLERLREIAGKRLLQKLGREPTAQEMAKAVSKEAKKSAADRSEKQEKVQVAMKGQKIQAALERDAATLKLQKTQAEYLRLHPWLCKPEHGTSTGARQIENGSPGFERWVRTNLRHHLYRDFLWKNAENAAWETVWDQ